MIYVVYSQSEDGTDIIAKVRTTREDILDDIINGLSQRSSEGYSYDYVDKYAFEYWYPTVESLEN